MAKKPQHAQNNQRSQQGKQGQQQKRGGKAQGGHTTHTPAAPTRPLAGVKEQELAEIVGIYDRDFKDHEKNLARTGPCCFG